MPAAPRDELSLRGRPLHALERHGQVVWISYLRRNLLGAGHLQRLMEEYAVAGISFDVELASHAIAAGPEYREQVDRLRAEGSAAEDILEHLLVEDVCLASSQLRGARSAELGGWVAVAVPPRYRASIDQMVRWAALLEDATGSERILVKLPATTTGLRALEGLVAAGHSVYADAIFGLEQLDRTLEAHARGLALRLAADEPLDRARLVAAVNLVRIDVVVDEMLRDRRRAGVGEPDMVESLHGRAAIAVGKLAWERLREWDSDPRQAELAARGARPAWLAWEGTRTLSPARRDVEYLEELIGPRTVAVVSRLALDAFRDHGRTAATVGRQLEEARDIVEDLRAVGIDLDDLADDLQEAALAAREARAEELVAAVDADPRRRAELTFEPGDLADRCSRLEEDADRLGLVRRLWERDPTLWPAGVVDPASVRDRLGWLGLPEAMADEALPVLATGPTDGETPGGVILLGMGGSSLGAEACRVAFDRRRFVVLDTTVPRGIATVAARSDTGNAIFLVASKSGNTLETLALADFFWQRADGDPPGERWVAITDPGTPLHETARHRGFQRIWLNPPDVGGRFSVLSYFGLVPMALMGIDIGRILGSATRMAVVSGAEIAPADNPAVRLGVFLAAALVQGRDKLTLLASPRLVGLADWVEQLVAESTGKDGRGLVPVSQEPVGDPTSYGDDRAFVRLRLAGDPVDAAEDQLIETLRGRGVPVVTFRLEDPHDLGAEFLRWELAVAVAGALAGFDPFDEPDVARAKRRTSELLGTAGAAGGGDAGEPLVATGHLEIHGDERRLEIGDIESPTPEDVLGAHLGTVAPPDYVAIQAFLAPDVETWHALQGLRALIRDQRGVATTIGWGPRFLHSTGQLHKGGGGHGVFLQLTAASGGDLAIPGRDYGFGALAAAQAMADYRTLREDGRRIVRVHLTGAVEAGLASLLEAVRRSLD